MVRRSGFTFIELIFAIVIIAISVISLPRMTQTVSNGIDANLVQEAIFAASTELNQAISANWDENSLLDTGANSLARVIDNGNCDNNSSSLRFRLKSGHIAQPYHRRCLDSNTTPIANASGTIVDALEDHIGTTTFTNAVQSQSGYKSIYSTTIAVDLNATFGGVTTTDIKMIEANISKVENATSTLITSLRAYSANVGEVDYYKRTY